MNKINQIVRLKQLVHRWRNRTTTHSLAIYIGPERHRFTIPTRFLTLPVFITLLNKAEEEYGYQISGGLILPCDVTFFKKLMTLLERNEREFGEFELDDFVKMFADVAIHDYSSVSCGNDSHSFFPLLRKVRV